jgi:hypothetical protein
LTAVRPIFLPARQEIFQKKTTATAATRGRPSAIVVPARGPRISSGARQEEGRIMQRHRPTAGVLAAALAIACVAPARAPAQAGGSYRIDRATIAAGGATLAGGTFRLSGTVGQPATAALSAAGYRLYDGFWSPATSPATDEIFANGFDP